MSEGLKRWYPVISSGIAVMFIVLYLGKCGDKPVTKPSDNTEWRTRVISLQAQIAAKDSLINEIREKRGIDSLENLRVSNGLKMREQALVRKLKQANADIQVIADSLPKVARYVELADSTIAVKDSLYNQEVGRRIADELSFRNEIKALADNNIKQVKISDDLTIAVTDLTRENGKLAKKLERKRKGNRLLGGIAAGVAAALGIMIIAQ